MNTPICVCVQNIQSRAIEKIGKEYEAVLPDLSLELWYKQREYGWAQRKQVIKFRYCPFCGNKYEELNERDRSKSERE